MHSLRFCLKNPLSQVLFCKRFAEYRILGWPLFFIDHHCWDEYAAVILIFVSLSGFLFKLAAFSFQQLDCLCMCVLVCFCNLPCYTCVVDVTISEKSYLFNYSFCPTPFSGTSVGCTLDVLFLSHNSWMLCWGVCFLFLFSLYFLFSSLCFLFMFPYLHVPWIFPWMFHSNNEPVKNFYLLGFLLQAFPLKLIII